MNKSYLAVREDGREIVATNLPIREIVKNSGTWNIVDNYKDDIAILRKGSCSVTSNSIGFI